LYEDVRELVPKPDFNFSHAFKNTTKRNTLGMSFVRISEAAETLFAKHKFDVVVVQGDTTTACALAQIAFYNYIPIAHVEAGLRTFDLWNPYPEELNRTFISQLATIHFAPTQQAYANLANMGVKNIHLTGNTIVDAVNFFKKKLHLSPSYSNRVLVTLHRRENHEIMEQLFEELQAIAVNFVNLELVFPIHPNPNVQKHRRKLKASNIHVIEPLSYPQIIRLINGCRFIITDSGGLQEEATCFNKKVLVARKKTERPETIEIGLSRLVGSNIRQHIDWALEPPPIIKSSPYGNGKSAKRIVELLA